MTQDEVDQALRRERHIEPSADFRPDVMRAVHAHAAASRQRTFKFDHLWSVVAVASVVVPLLVAMRLLSGAEGGSGEAADATRWLLFTLTGTLAAARWCTRDATSGS
jgi:hypothetical protein